MRLINADAIEYEDILEPTGNGMYCNEKHVYQSDIDAQPTIDAIPVEFIEAEIKRMELEIDIAMSEYDYETTERWIVRKTALEFTLEKWKAENTY